MAKVKKLIINLDDAIDLHQVDELANALATLFDIAGVSYAIEYAEEECEDEQAS